MKKILIYITICLFFLFFAFVGGCQYHKKTFKCPEIKIDTTYIHDTIPHYIIGSFPYYIQGKDSIIHDTIPRKVDTLAILQDYYNKHVYARKWENDTLKVNISDTITQNIPIGNLFSYKIKVPFETIINNVDNSVHYANYIYLGVGINNKNINRTSLDALYAGKKGAIGMGYAPFAKEFTIKGYVPILKIK